MMNLLLFEDIHTAANVILMRDSSKCFTSYLLINSKFSVGKNFKKFIFGFVKEDQNLAAKDKSTIHSGVLQIQFFSLTKNNQADLHNNFTFMKNSPALYEIRTSGPAAT
jgi:hypothetical protein